MNILAAHGLVKEFGVKRVVDQASLNVQAGEVVGLLGPNGAGKTTTFYMLVGIYAPDAGRVTFNDDEITEFGRLSLDHPFHVRFIEYMPIGNSRASSRDQILTPEIREKIATIGELTSVGNGQNDGPARRYRIAGAQGEVGFISAMSHHFCSRCNRLRLTADGKLRACLLSDRHEPLKELLRNGGSDEQLSEIFRITVRHKAAKHQLCPDGVNTVKDQMQGIGG